jgi:hypothetical protein
VRHEFAGLNFLRLSLSLSNPADSAENFALATNAMGEMHFGACVRVCVCIRTCDDGQAWMPWCLCHDSSVQNIVSRRVYGFLRRVDSISIHPSIHQSINQSFTYPAHHSKSLTDIRELPPHPSPERHTHTHSHTPLFSSISRKKVSGDM